MDSLADLLEQRLAPAFAVAAGQAWSPSVRRSQHADFQADGALGLARRLGVAPRPLAEQVARQAKLDDLCSAVTVAGAGFINLTLADEVLGRRVAELVGDERLGANPTTHPEVVTIDYSAPNAAKEMHVGHLRSTIIGDAAVRLLEWLGHTVIRENHIGEWGTPFGMLIEHLLDVGEAEAAHELSVGDLDGFYKAARRAFDSDGAFAARSRERVVLLQSGDPTTLRLWRRLVDESTTYFMAVYNRLGVRLTEADFFGESYYHDQLQSIVDELDGKGLLSVSEGALCVFPPGFTNRAGEALPLIVRKADGGFGYGGTDLATIRHRLRVREATRLVYVVGVPQSQHLAMVFAVAQMAGWLAPPARAEHVGHGSILGADGKMLKSRAGAAVKLVDLLDEAVARAYALANPELDEATRHAVARAVGIGAVKYADLSIDRAKDYVFDLDRMLSFDGNTSAYLQFAYTRIRAIFGKGAVEPPQDVQGLTLTEPAERALALELLAFGSLVVELGETLEFHRLATYLHGLAVAFTAFYETCPVLRSEGEVRVTRLVLCELTARTLAQGLALLGIESPERM
jgi:arginyl-tRNA synthetase